MHNKQEVSWADNHKNPKWQKIVIMEHVTIEKLGIEAHGINPYMKRAMEKLNYSLEGHTSNTMDEYENMHFDYVLTVCDHANNNCPYFKDATHRIHHSFEDP
ncbi:hypothetical protein N9Y89_02180 [bacterium]|nr:hypothetical protein [bacterium]